MEQSGERMLAADDEISVKFEAALSKEGNTKVRSLASARELLLTLCGAQVDLSLTDLRCEGADKVALAVHDFPTISVPSLLACPGSEPVRHAGTRYQLQLYPCRWHSENRLDPAVPTLQRGSTITVLRTITLYRARSFSTPAHHL